MGQMVICGREQLDRNIGKLFFSVGPHLCYLHLPLHHNDMPNLTIMLSVLSTRHDIIRLGIELKNKYLWFYVILHNNIEYYV